MTQLMAREVLTRRPSVDLTGQDLRELLIAVTDHVCDLVDRISDRPVANAHNVEHLLSDPQLRRTPPDSGRPVEELLDVISRAAAKGVNPAHGGLLGFVPGGGIPAAAIADLIANILNRHTGQAAYAPGLVALEADLLRWLGDLFGLPSGSAGLLTTGTSMATLSAMITARTALLTDVRTATLYVTSQTHAHVAKAARLLGFPAAAIRMVAVDKHLRMIPAALRSAVAIDRAAGRRPFLVVASAGTTNTGVVDPLQAISDLAAAEGLWLHVDAAYGGFFQLTERAASGSPRRAPAARGSPRHCSSEEQMRIDLANWAYDAADTPDYLRPSAPAACWFAASESASSMPWIRTRAFFCQC